MSLELKAIVTDVGLAAASIATPKGPYIEIAKFKVATDYGFDPDRYDNDIHGPILYEAQPTTYQFLPPKTINVKCRIPAIAGPWEFGNIGLFLPTGELFALVAFPTPQLKTSSLTTNVAGAYTFNCLINLEQSVAVFKIDAEFEPAVLEVDKWSDVQPSDDGPNPEVPLYIVRELDPWGDASELHKASGTRWTVGSTYRPIVDAAITSSTTTTMTVPVANLKYGQQYYVGRPNRSFVVRNNASGLFRSVQSVAVSGTNLVFTFNPDPLPAPMASGSTVTVLAHESLPIPWSNIYGVPYATRTQKGIVSIGNGLGVDTAGHISAAGMLHSAPGTGRLLTASDNINNGPDTPSGLYSASGVSLPTGWPGIRGGRMEVSDVDGIAAQSIYFRWQPGDAPGNIYSRPVYRTYQPSGGWSPWMYFDGSLFGQAGGIFELVRTFGSGETATGNYLYDGETIMAVTSGGNPAIQGYINGNFVAAGDSDGGGESVTLPGLKGQEWSVWARRGGSIWRVVR